MTAPDFPGPYGDFLRDYHAVVVDHCVRVAEAAPMDAALLEWGATLHQLLPGFPSVDALHDPSVLGRALAGFVHAVVVWHSAEHHAYGKEPVTRVPQRLRVPEPVGEDPPTDPRTWLASIDVARQELARRMFYQDSPIRCVLDVDYGFSEACLSHAQDQFFRELRECEQRQTVNYIPLDRMACSIQY